MAYKNQHKTKTAGTEVLHACYQEAFHTRWQKRYLRGTGILTAIPSALPFVLFKNDCSRHGSFTSYSQWKCHYNPNVSNFFTVVSTRPFQSGGKCTLSWCMWGVGKTGVRGNWDTATKQHSYIYTYRRNGCWCPHCSILCPSFPPCPYPDIQDHRCIWYTIWIYIC